MRLWIQFKKGNIILDPSPWTEPYSGDMVNTMNRKRETGNTTTDIQDPPSLAAWCLRWLSTLCRRSSGSWKQNPAYQQLRVAKHSLISWNTHGIIIYLTIFIPLFTIYHGNSSYIIRYHHISLDIIMYHHISLIIIIYHHISLYRQISLTLSLSPSCIRCSLIIWVCLKMRCLFLLGKSP